MVEHEDRASPRAPPLPQQSGTQDQLCHFTPVWQQDPTALKMSSGLCPVWEPTALFPELVPNPSDAPLLLFLLAPQTTASLQSARHPQAPHGRVAPTPSLPPGFAEGWSGQTQPLGPGARTTAQQELPPSSHLSHTQLGGSQPGTPPEMPWSS